MQELRLVAVSEDGTYAVLVAPGRSGRFALPIDDRLRTVARGQFSRLAQYDIEVESPLRPKEIQDRIRAGETAEEIADAAGLPVDRIRRFEGPVLAEREYQAQQAQRATVRGRGEGGPGPRLGDIVTERLAGAGISQDDADWDSRKRPDGNWQVQLACTVAGRMQIAEWVFDPRGKHVIPDNDHAARLCLPEEQWPPPRPGDREHVTATVTPISSRSVPAGGHFDPGRAATGRQPGSATQPVHPSHQVPARATGLGGTAQAPPSPPMRPAAASRRPTAAPRPPAVAPGPPAVAPAGLTGPGSAGPAPAQAPPAQPAAASDHDDAAAAAAGAPEPTPDPGRPAPGPRPARRSSGRSRRSSVPSWDEIMFGNSRQPD